MQLEKISRREFLKNIGSGLAGLTLFGAFPQSASAVATYPYSFEKFSNGYHLYREDKYNQKKHFMSVLTSDANGGILAIRPHPDGGDNDNAWGSTLYMQPFLPGATLKGTTVSTPKVDNDADGIMNGITISASGKVSRGTSQTFGNWTFSMKFSYVNGKVESTKAGRYSITLDDKLSDLTGDLNAIKLASNYLHNVPRLGMANGDTGDMSLLNVLFNDSFKRTWVPTQGTTYPGDLTNILTLDLKGNYNNVDTVAQGHKRIEPAYKPNMKIRIKRPTSELIRTGMFLGTAYDELNSQDFEDDNVAILPLILRSAPEKVFNFDITFESTPFRKSSAIGWEKYE